MNRLRTIARGICWFSCLLWIGFAGNLYGFPLAKQGLIDFQQESFSAAAFAPLDGEWRFSPGHLLSPQSFENSSATLAVPGYWLSHFAVAAGTYQLHVLLPNNQKPFALFIPEQATAFRLWINDSLYAEDGVLDVMRAKVIPGDGDTLVMLPSLTEFTITAQVASHDENRGGLGSSILLGSYSSLSHRWIKRQMIDALLVGALFFMGLYHLILFFHRRRQWVYLTLALICLTWSMRFMALGMGGRLITLIFPQIPYNSVVKMELVPLFSIAALGLIFIWQNFPDLLARWVLRISFLLATLGIVATPFLSMRLLDCITSPFEYFNLLCVIPAGMILTKAIRRKMLGGIPITIGFVCFFILATNDILFDMRLIYTDHYIHLGILALVISFAFVLSRRYAEAFAQVEQQNRVLLENQELRQSLARQAEYLRQSQQMHRSLEQILDTVKEPLFACGDDGDIAYANTACLQLLNRNSIQEAPFALNEILLQGFASNNELQQIVLAGKEIERHELLELALRSNDGAQLLCQGFVSTIAVDEQILTVCLFSKRPQEATAILLAVNQQQSRDAEFEFLRCVLASAENSRNPKLTKILGTIDASFAEMKSILHPKVREDATLVTQGVNLLKAAIAFWEQNDPSKSKLDLARESGLWTVYMNRDGWERTQTLDRYLSPETFPLQARWPRVIKTVEFVLENIKPSDSDAHTELQNMLLEFKPKV